jgi:hypothetical protein
MPNYKNAKIYKLIDDTNNNIYIGAISKRIAQHRLCYRKYLNHKHKYLTLFEILKNNNYDIILIEKCENIQTKKDLNMRQKYYIENYKCINYKCINNLY